LAILVTGGAGFIGSHLLDKLSGRDEEIICLDNFNDYYDPSIKRKNIDGLLKAKKIRLIAGDITDEDTLEHVFQNEKIETIVHLAARAGVRPSIQEPLLYERVNCRGTLLLLEHARRRGINKFVFASSSSVYGNCTETPFREDMDISRPVSPYAATKGAAEALCHTYHHLFGLDITALRFFTVYGARQRPDMAIHKFTRLIQAGKQIPMFGDGTTSRDYTYYKDIIAGVVAAIDTPMGFEIINLGEKRTTELRCLIELIGEAVGKTPRIKQLPLQPGDVTTTCAETAKAKELLGYNPEWTVEKGIPEFVKWFLNNR